MSNSSRIPGLIELGYSPGVAKRIVEQRPDLAQDLRPPLLAYRGLSGGEDSFDPTQGKQTDVVIAGPIGAERAIRKAQEFALGVFWGNTKPSADGRYTVVEYHLPREVLDQKGAHGTDSFQRSAVPNERLFISRIGSFHLREHAPVSAIEWHEPDEER